MTDYNAILRATRSSASAVAAISRHQFDIRHADKTMAWNTAMAARGYMSAEAMKRDNAICATDRARAVKALADARARYERAEKILSRNHAIIHP